MSTDQDVAPPSNRKFGLTIGIALLLLGLVPPLLGGHFGLWFLMPGGLFVLLALVTPKLLAVPNQIWFRFGLLLHRIVNPLVLGAVFLVAVTPIGIAMRLAGKNLLNRRYEPAAKSYWIPRDPSGPTPDSIRNQF